MAVRHIFLFIVISLGFLTQKGFSQTIHGGFDCLGELCIIDIFYTGPGGEYVFDFTNPPELGNPKSPEDQEFPGITDDYVRILGISGPGSPYVENYNGTGEYVIKLAMPRELYIQGIDVIGTSDPTYTTDWELVISKKDPYTNCYYHYHITVNVKILV